jgi:ATP-dependent DNA helicase RecQ
VNRVDISTDARIFMSAMARTNERFGIVHIIDIVMGADTRRIRELRHHEIKTFGAGRHQDKNHWRFIVNELLAQEAIRQDGDRYPVLKLTPKGANVLMGKEGVFGLKREEVKTKERRRKTAEGGWYDETLFDRLRAIRKRIAGTNHVPPFVIFSDKTLHEMCRHFPKTASEMRQISGVGDVKLERYGEEFLEEIRTYGGSER